ncbi:hypothetical protein B9Z55_006533 [Caenorhabditis nigoni]|uniref:Uncharacterized protein n=1 Tax=Caenorhabditis nigoni TaxID=1611254 RepID=A0A2G5V5N8_9PELO|nr:hypothetical protein B9Z55_006533 [Caenorhabditis nigoni]
MLCLFLVYRCTIFIHSEWVVFHSLELSFFEHKKKPEELASMAYQWHLLRNKCSEGFHTCSPFDMTISQFTCTFLRPLLFSSTRLGYCRNGTSFEYTGRIAESRRN